MNRQKGKKSQIRVSWAEALRDVIIAAINKGQLPILGAIAFVFVIFLRMPEGSIPDFVENFMNLLAAWNLVGYILFLLSIFAWFFHVRHMRASFSREYRRIGKEKSELQEKQMGKRLKSSDSV